MSHVDQALVCLSSQPVVRTRDRDDGDGRLALRVGREYPRSTSRPSAMLRFMSSLPRRPRRRLVAWTVILSAIVACGSDAITASGPPPQGDPGEAGAPDASPAGDAEAAACVNMDVLFIIDESPSMKDEQHAVAESARPLMAKLDRLYEGCGPEVDFRVAVTTSGRSIRYTTTDPPLALSESGHDGRFRKVCGMTRSWVQRGDPDRAENFACAIEVGVDGPAIEMPFESMALALGARVADGVNAGFLREDALLAVVVLTDADDCSRKDDDFTLARTDCNDPSAGSGWSTPREYVSFLDTLKGSRARWTLTAIAGENACESDAGGATEAVRLKRFVAQAGSSGTFASICSGDLTPGLDAAISSFEAGRRRVLRL